MMRLVIRIVLEGLRYVREALLSIYEAIFNLLFTPSNDEEPPQVKPIAHLHAAAIHEAGHLIAAWYCTEVSRIKKLTVEASEDNGGYLDYLLMDGPKYPYCRTVICFAGFTAELMLMGKASGGSSSGDLERVRKLKLSGSWPWKKGGEGSIPFDRLFVEPPEGEELELMNEAYRLAKRLLIHYRKQHHHVTKALLEKRTLYESDLQAILGSRKLTTIIHANLKGPGFVLPSKKAA